VTMGHVSAIIVRVGKQ